MSVAPQSDGAGLRFAQPEHVMIKNRKDRPTAIRMVLPFVFRHWRNQPWLGSGLALAMVGATVSDLFMPLFAGRLVDAIALGATRLRGSEIRRDLRVRRHHRARARADHVPSLRPVGHRAVHAARDERHRARCVPPGAALLHRLACEQLCRLDGAQGHARHVGGRPVERHDPAGAAAVGGGAGRDRRSCSACTGRRSASPSASARSPTSA